MRKYVIGFVVLLFLGVVVGPVAYRQLNPAEPRSLEGVQLAETTYEEVQFRNEAQDIDLAAMLFLPEGEGPFPAAVFIHGSGDSRRDNRWYVTMADHFQRNGVAVLLPDKRGCEQSSGEWRGASFEDLATDTEAAVQYLTDSHAEMVSYIGIIGCSQGGQIVPIAASRSEDIAFAINVVGSAVPFHDALVYEETHNIRSMGVLPGISNAIARASSLYIRKAGQKEFWDAIGNYDPLPYWSEVSVPALVLYGAEDTNTPSECSAERLGGLERPNLRVVIFEGSGHPLEDPVGAGNRLVRLEALDAMTSSIRESSPLDDAGT